MPKKIDFGSDEQFIQLYNELKSAAKVGEYYGCSKNPVLRHAQKIGYDINSNKNYKLTAQDKEYILNAYKKETSTSLAEKFGVSRGMITKIWYDANLKGKERDFSNYGNNLIGKTFGYLTVIDFSEKRSANGGKFWKCKCTCGLPNCQKEKEVEGASLLNGKVISCGAIGKGNLKNGQGLNFENLIGETFGALKVLERVEDKIFPSGAKAVQYKCQCQCGRETYVLASNLKSGNTQSCGLCSNNSHGNLKIEQLFKENNIFYEREKRFPTCKDTFSLPFDFYVNNLYCVEFDGKQHFQNTNTFYNYEETHNHDIIKNNWCKENNIPLIRIPYTHLKDLKIEDLLLETSKFIV